MEDEVVYTSLLQEFMVREKKDEFLKNLSIDLPFEPHPLHCHETCLSYPTKGQKKTLEKLGILFSGVFTQEEDAIILKNWEEFQKQYGIKNASLLLRSRNLNYTERKNFLQYIGHGLPNRALCSIRNRFNTLCVRRVRGRFTPDEIKIVRQHLSKGNDTTPCYTLSRLLNRESKDLYYILKRKKFSLSSSSSRQEPIINWNLHLCQRVLDSLLNITGSKNFLSLRYREITTDEWSMVGKECGLPEQLIKNFWNMKMSTMLFAEELVFSKDLRIELIKRFYHEGTSTWENISWQLIAQDFEGVNPVFLCKVFVTFLLRRYRDVTWFHIKKNFRKVIEDLYSRLPSLGNKKDYQLVKLVVNNSGKLSMMQVTGVKN